LRNHVTATKVKNGQPGLAHPYPGKLKVTRSTGLKF
jgi:hypothetical protein